MKLSELQDWDILEVSCSYTGSCHHMYFLKGSFYILLNDRLALFEKLIRTECEGPSLYRGDLIGDWKVTHRLKPLKSRLKGIFLFNNYKKINEILEV